MHIWALGLSCETPAAPLTRQQGPGASTPPKFHERTPRERRKKKKNVAGGGKKKARNFGPPTLLGSTLLGSTLRRPHTLSSQNSTCKNWPKTNWPKSKLAEVDRAHHVSGGNAWSALTSPRCHLVSFSPANGAPWGSICWSSRAWNPRSSGFCSFVALGAPFLSVLTPPGAAVLLAIVATTGQLVADSGAKASRVHFGERSSLRPRQKGAGFSQCASG